jgi:hypothetical protein
MRTGQPALVSLAHWLVCSWRRDCRGHCRGHCRGRGHGRGRERGQGRGLRRQRGGEGGADVCSAALAVNGFTGPGNPARRSRIASGLRPSAPKGPGLTAAVRVELPWWGCAHEVGLRAWVRACVHAGNGRAWSCTAYAAHRLLRSTAPAPPISLKYELRILSTSTGTLRCDPHVDRRRRQLQHGPRVPFNCISITEHYMVFNLPLHEVPLYEL